MEPPVEENKELAEEKSIADSTGENADVKTDSAGAEKDQEEETAEPEDQEAANTVEEPPEAPQTPEQKQSNILNLNNEVVKMRKEVKRVRALIIRKMTRQIGALKKKKGKEEFVERNQRRAARLLEEIHAIKNLVPDKVTKTALQKNLNFEQVCKDPKSSISDRAVARIASHPQFNKKIDSIKAAVKEFKDERSKEDKPKGKKQKKADKPKKQLPQTDTERESNEASDKTAVIIKASEKDLVEASVDSSSLCPRKAKVEETPQTLNKIKKPSPVKHIEKSKPQNKSNEKKITSKPSKVPINVEAESDLDLSDSEEKEYFDDSTEERFHKHSSAESEDSDNDFFVGKINKFKKKKKTKNTVEQKVEKTLDENSKNPLHTDKVQDDLDELESRLKSQITSLNSVFCASLARPKARKGPGKSDRKVGGQFKSKAGARDGNVGFNKQNNFQKQTNSDSKYKKPYPGDRSSAKEHKNVGGAGPAKAFVRQKDARNRSFHQVPAQALHPSWEASKKRKEQQGQILAFQGKKIKFDDD